MRYNIAFMLLITYITIKYQFHRGEIINLSTYRT
jgi:hypothetical protein